VAARSINPRWVVLPLLADGPAIVPFALVAPRFAALLPFGVSAAVGEVLVPFVVRFAPRPVLLAISVSAK